MVQDQVAAIDLLRKRRAKIDDDILRKIDGLVISVLTADTDRAFSPQDLCQALHNVDFELLPKDAYSLLAKLGREKRIQAEGAKYRGIGPGVMNRQLRETSAPKAKR